MYRTSMMAAAATFALGAAMTGCGSDESTSASDGAGGKNPIKVMVMGPIKAKAFSLPSIPAGPQAVAEAINVKGGVGGRDIEVVVCDDDYNPNGATKCARQAVKDGVVAMVGGFTASEAQVLPILERAKIPWVGPTPVSNFSSPVYYLEGGETASTFFGAGQALKSDGCKSIGTLVEGIPVAKQGGQLAELGVAAAGEKPGGTVTVPANAADWAPGISSLAAKGVDCAVLVASPPGGVRAMKAVAESGKDLKIATALAIVPDQSLKTLGSAVDGKLIVTGGYYPFSTDKPAVAQMVAEVKAKAPGAPVDTFTQTGTAAMKTFAHAIRDVGDVTAATVTKALDTMEPYDTGLGPVVSFRTPNPAATFSRVVNTKVFTYEVRDGQYVLKSDEPIDVASAYAAAAAASK